MSGMHALLAELGPPRSIFLEFFLPELIGDVASGSHVRVRGEPFVSAGKFLCCLRLGDPGRPALNSLDAARNEMSLLSRLLRRNFFRKNR